MKNTKTYSIVEIDANDRTLVLASQVSRSAAIARLARLRETFGKDGLRFVMYHDKEN